MMNWITMNWKIVVAFAVMAVLAATTALQHWPDETCPNINHCLKTSVMPPPAPSDPRSETTSSDPESWLLVNRELFTGETTVIGKPYWNSHLCNSAAALLTKSAPSLFAKAACIPSDQNPFPNQNPY